ncbi:hypothetical protein ATANTOWER_010169 [Ataeniobius toweri]|uniref:Uncharacterized protein n=1 Tax=Ataeniobius toweri TaxID=208326 RepID=A0ABU7AXU2_9TELE|nr:hypothetical protein [Ataeniobius toweri]
MNEKSRKNISLSLVSRLQCHPSIAMLLIMSSVISPSPSLIISFICQNMRRASLSSKTEVGAEMVEGLKRTNQKLVLCAAECFAP